MNDPVLKLEIVIWLNSLETFIAQLRHALEGRAWPEVAGLASPIIINRKPKRPPETSLVKLVDRLLTIAKDPTEVVLYFGERSLLTWGQRPDRKTIAFSLSTRLADHIFADPIDNVRCLTHVGRALIAQGAVQTALVEYRSSMECLPAAPIARTRRPFVWTDAAEVDAAYDRPDEFWSAGWTIEELGGRRLLTRCQDVIEPAAVLGEIQAAQWQMARAARPKLTGYGRPTTTPAERPIYEQGDPWLHPVGLQSSTSTAIYSCVLEPGTHLHGFEIYYLESLVDNKRMQDGTPVDHVRVIFQKQWMAESERRPLLDNGIEVFYRSLDTGELVEITS